MLEFFASHRMTNDTLGRVLTDGTRELVGACQEFYLADDPKAREEYFDHNRRFYADVEARGLLDHVATHTAINMHLRTGGEE